jgi:hypothetical protein
MQMAALPFHRFLKTLAEELDGDLWRHFLDRLADFIGRIGQTVRVDVDANAAAGHCMCSRDFNRPMLCSRSPPQLGHWNLTTCASAWASAFGIKRFRFVMQARSITLVRPNEAIPKVYFSATRRSLPPVGSGKASPTFRGAVFFVARVKREGT